PTLNLIIFSFDCSPDHRDLHSFPTRRSSDLLASINPKPLIDALSPGKGTMKNRGLGRKAFSKAIGKLGRKADLGHQDERGSAGGDRKSTRLNSSHVAISYAVFCLKKKITGQA